MKMTKVKTVILFRKGYGTISCPAMAALLEDAVSARIDEDIPESEWLIRWGTTHPAGNRKTINKRDAITKSATKSTMRYSWSQAGLAPETFVSRKEFLSSDTSGEWIVRPTEHMRSQDLTLCKTVEECKAAVDAHPSGFYVSKYIPKVFEYRVFAAQNRVFGMIEKNPENREDISWGCITDGKFTYLPWSYWPKGVVENALKALQMTGLDFAALDIIVDKDGRAYCLETNTAPWCNSEYWQKSHAKIFNYMINKTRDPFPDITSYDWQSAIHPAMVS